MSPWALEVLREATTRQLGGQGGWPQSFGQNAQRHLGKLLLNTTSYFKTNKRYLGARALWKSITSCFKKISFALKLPASTESRYLEESYNQKIFKVDLSLVLLLGFLGNFPDKEYLHWGDLDLIHELRRSLKKERLPSPVFWPGELHGFVCIVCEVELNMTE